LFGKGLAEQNSVSSNKPIGLSQGAMGGDKMNIGYAVPVGKNEIVSFG